MEKLEEEIKKMGKRLKEEEKKFKEVKLLKKLANNNIFSISYIGRDRRCK